MFGQKDDNANQPAEESTVGGEGVSGPAPIASAATDPTASLSDNSAWQHPGPPPAPQQDVFSPAGGFPNAASNKISTSSSQILNDQDDSDDSAVSSAADDLVSSNDMANGDLVEIKQKALTELAPLIDQLDMSPEDKFRTIMMMIQASDDQRLVEKAYETAHTIENEHARAQALLDIVNEINYFTQPASPSQPTS